MYTPDAGAPRLRNGSARRVEATACPTFSKDVQPGSARGNAESDAIASPRSATTRGPARPILPPRVRRDAQHSCRPRHRLRTPSRHGELPDRALISRRPQSWSLLQQRKRPLDRFRAPHRSRSPTAPGESTCPRTLPPPSILRRRRQSRVRAGRTGLADFPSPGRRWSHAQGQCTVQFGRLRDERVRRP